MTNTQRLSTKLFLFVLIFVLTVFSFNAIGNAYESQTFGGVESDSAFRIIKTEDEKLVMFGKTYSFGAGSADMYLVVYDESTQTYADYTYGGTDYDQGHDIIETDDEFLLVGLSVRNHRVVYNFTLKN